MLQGMTPETPTAPSIHHATETSALRDATIDDAEEIEAVHYAAREAVYADRVEDWPPPGPDRSGRIERWRRWLSTPDIDCIVATASDGIVGFVTVRPSRDDDAPADMAEMPTLYVHPDHWRRGHGGALCAASVQRAMNRGFRKLSLWVLDMNARARVFYRSFGFTPDGATKVDDGTKERLLAHRYVLSLTEAE